MMEHIQKLKKLWIVAGMVVLVILPMATMNVFAQDDVESVQEDTETAVQDCAECHLDSVIDWQVSPHAQSFTSELFQTLWTGDTTCLSCHTTGYQAYNGEYTHAAVSCEACHGQTPANHPDEPIATSPGVEVCADCHTTTFAEWETSGHGNAELECSSCHNPHEQTIRLGDSTTLCLNCHEETMSEGYAHLTHQEQQCTDCHWHYGEFDVEAHAISGILSASGHDSNVETLACTNCHEGERTNIANPLSSGGDDVSQAEATAEPGDEAMDDDHSEDGEHSGNAVTNNRLRIQELEAEVANAIALGENTSAVRLMQGLVVGIALGGALTLILMRLRPGRNVAPREDEE
jgi:predicted CXXCH cytochrome family protein